MKTQIIPFECFIKKGIQKNNCIVQILEPKNGNDQAEIFSISFQKPFSAVSWNQFIELYNQIIQAAKNEQDQFEKHGIVTVGEMGAILPKNEKALTGFQNKLKGMFKTVEKDMSEKEKETVNKAFDLVNELLGNKK